MEQRKARQTLDHSPDPAELGQRNSSHLCGMCRGGACCWERWQVRSSAERDEGVRAQQNRYRVAAARQTVSRLKNTLLPKRSLAAGYKDRTLVPHACLPQVALSLGRVRGKCPDAARLRHQRAEKTWKQCVHRIWRVPLVWLLPGPTAGTRRNLQHRRRDTHAFTPWCPD